MIDPTFRNIDLKLFQSFKVGDNNPSRNSFFMYYMLLVGMKDFNVLIDNKS